MPSTHQAENMWIVSRQIFAPGVANLLRSSEMPYPRRNTISPGSARNARMKHSGNNKEVKR